MILEFGVLTLVLIIIGFALIVSIMSIGPSRSATTRTTTGATTGARTVTEMRKVRPEIKATRSLDSINSRLPVSTLTNPTCGCGAGKKPQSNSPNGNPYKGPAISLAKDSYVAQVQDGTQTGGARVEGTRNINGLRNMGGTDNIESDSLGKKHLGIAVNQQSLGSQRGNNQRGNNQRGNNQKGNSQRVNKRNSAKSPTSEPQEHKKPIRSCGKPNRIPISELNPMDLDAEP